MRVRGHRTTRYVIANKSRDMLRPTLLLRSGVALPDGRADQQFSFEFLSVGRGICLISNGTEGGAGARQHSWRDWWRLFEGQREQQIFPGCEDQVCRDRRQLAEEVITRAELCARIAPEFVANIADRMNGEGQ